MRSSAAVGACSIPAEEESLEKVAERKYSVGLEDDEEEEEEALDSAWSFLGAMKARAKIYCDTSLVTNIDRSSRRVFGLIMFRSNISRLVGLAAKSSTGPASRTLVPRSRRK